MLKNSTIGRGLVLVAMFFLTSPAVYAGDDCGRCCDRKKVKGDVGSLKARLEWRDGQWCLWVRYKVKIKRANHCDAIDLVLTPTECGRALSDQHGQGIAHAISLPTPGNYCRGDKYKFRDEVTFLLPEGSIANPRRVRVYAELIDRRRDRLLDDKSKKVKVCGVPCEVIAVDVRYETRFETYRPPTVVYVEPAPVIYSPPIVTYHYSHAYWPAYDCGPRFYPVRSFGYRSHFAWGRGWGRGGFWGW